MSTLAQRAKKVYEAIRDVLSDGDCGDGAFRPGDIDLKLRAQGQPLAAWEIRGEFSALEGEGLITLNEASGAWTVVQDTAKKQASC